MIHRLHFSNRNVPDSACEVFLIVRDKNPPEVKQAVSKPEIKMLVAMHFIVFLGFTKSEKGFGIYIVVYTVNICVSMMNDIVLGLPHEIVGA